MRFSGRSFSLCIATITLLSTLGAVNSFPLPRVAEALNVPVPDVVLGRITGLMSDWFVNDAQAGVTVHKHVVEVPRNPEDEHETRRQQEEREIDMTSYGNSLARRIADIYGNLKSEQASIDLEGASAGGQDEAHRVSKREVQEPEAPTDVSGEENGTAAGKILRQPRTFGRNRCTLKLVCNFDEEGEARQESYPMRAARIFGDFWERYKPGFLEYIFGRDETIVLARTTYGRGCFLHHNSCPMRIVNVVMLATALQRMDERSVRDQALPVEN